VELLFIPAALLAGGLLAVQAGANAQLSKAVGSPFGATAIQLSVGTLALLAVAALTGGLVSLAGLPRVPWWHAAGGTASAFYVVSKILLFPRLKRSPAGWNRIVIGSGSARRDSCVSGSGRGRGWRGGGGGRWGRTCATGRWRTRGVPRGRLRRASG
jgi:hypothetical protein